MIKGIIRTLAFVRKELFSILRQPRLILGLIVGPFLVLTIFGVSYRGNSSYKTVLVVPNKPDISTKVSDYQDISKQGFNLVSISKNEAEARAALNRDEVDVVIVVPPNALDEIYAGQSAKFPIYYRTLNPLQANYLEFSTYLYTSEFNKIVTQEALKMSKPGTNQLQELTKQMDTVTTQLDQAMQNNNLAEAKLRLQTLKEVSRLSRTSLENMIIPEENKPATASQNLLFDRLSRNVVNNSVAQIKGDLDNLDKNAVALENGFNRGDVNSAQQRANLEGIRQSNAAITEKSNKVRSIPPEVLVQPVLSAAQNQISTKVSFINFYAPAVIILLIQYLAITLVSLSNVRDRTLGAVEVFRVAPVSPTQILLGKFVSFAIWLVVMVAILVALVVGLLNVPFVNLDSRWWQALLTVGVTIYASIGLGFIVAGLSRTESQAIQWNMILFLASLFFTGFVVPLTMFWDYIQYVSFFIPMTSGVLGLQNAMLDSRPLDFTILIAPLGLGTIYLAIGLFLYRRQFKIE